MSPRGERPDDPQPGSRSAAEAAPGDPSRPVPTRPEDTEPVAGAQPASAPGAPETPVPPTRAGVLWVTAIAAAAVLLFLLIFILQNGQSVQVTFLGADGHIPLGVALLLAAVCGVLLVAVPGTARILQLRRRARRPAQASPPRRGDSQAPTTG